MTKSMTAAAGAVFNQLKFRLAVNVHFPIMKQFGSERPQPRTTNP